MALVNWVKLKPNTNTYVLLGDTTKVCDADLTILKNANLVIEELGQVEGRCAVCHLYDHND